MKNRDKLLENFLSNEIDNYDYDLGNITLSQQTKPRNLPISFPEDEYSAIQEYCEKHEIKKATFVKKAIKDFLENLNG